MKPCKATSSTRDIDRALTLASDKRFNETARKFWHDCITLLLSLPGDNDAPAEHMLFSCITGR